MNKSLIPKIGVNIIFLISSFIWFGFFVHFGFNVLPENEQYIPIITCIFMVIAFLIPLLISYLKQLAYKKLGYDYPPYLILLNTTFIVLFIPAICLVVSEIINLI